MLRKGIDDLRIAAPLAVFGSHHCHGRQEWDAGRGGAVEATRQHDRFAGHFDQFMVRSGDAGLTSQPQRDLLPGLDAIVVGLLREFGDGEVAMLIDDGCFRPCSAERGAGCEDKLEILFRFFVSANPLGNLQEPSEFDQGRRRGSAPGKSLACPAESQAPRRVSSATPSRQSLSARVRTARPSRSARRRSERCIDVGPKPSLVNRDTCA